MRWNDCGRRSMTHWSKPHDGIHRYLVRYQPLDAIGWFGSIHAHPVARGDRVLVDTPLGRWSGELLLIHSPDEAWQGDWKPFGELLGPLDADPPIDPSAEAEAGGDGPVARWAPMEAFEETKRAIDRLHVAIAVLQVHRSRCCRQVIIECMGVPTSALGPLSIELARRWHVDRVQFLANNPIAPPADGPAMSSPRPHDDLREALRAARLGAPATFEKRLRPLAQLCGWYWQKRRPSVGGPIERRLPSTASLMLRVRTRLGQLTGRQFAGLMAIADAFGDGTLRLTARQSLQLHGVPIGQLPRVHVAIEDLLLSTRGACGFAARNVTCCPLPPSVLRQSRTVHERAYRLAIEISKRLEPQSDIFQWLWREDPTAGWNPLRSDLDEPLLGADYLPQKLKVGVATTQDNCIDVLVNDVAVLVDCDQPDWSILSVGGSTSFRIDRPSSHAALARPIIRLPTSEVGAAIDSIVRWFADAPRDGLAHHRRLKYRLNDGGWEALQRSLAACTRGTPTVADAPRQQPAHPHGSDLDGNRPEPIQFRCSDDHFGWHACEHGDWVFGWNPSSARIDCGSDRGKMLRAWIELQQPTIRLTPQHRILFGSIGADRRGHWEEATRAGGVLEGSQSAVRQMACPALPTCGQALAESENVFVKWRDAVDETFKSLGFSPPTLSMSGCPNGCSRPLTAMVGLVAVGVQRYRVFVGGCSQSSRMGVSIGEVTGPEELAQRLRNHFRHAIR
jgi:sulfite reductase (ferredoxin)